MYKPLVSIALTTSKSEKFIEKQIDSILNQTYQNIEVCVSHDECGDRTADLLKKYSLLDKRFRWEYNPGKKGLLKNSENAINMCKGEFVFLADHDDWWDLSRIQKHLTVYENHPEVSWVYNNSILVDEQGTAIGKLEETAPDYFSSKKITLLNLTWGTCIGAAHTSYRAKDLKTSMPIPDFALAHDSWIQLCLYPKKSFFLNEDLYYYRQHEHNYCGWGKSVKKEDFFELEKKSIENNMRYIKNLYQYNKIAFWKRIFFFAVYTIKSLRALFTKGKPVSSVSA